MQNYINKISGATIERIAESEYTEGTKAIIIGETELEKSITAIDRNNIGADGLRMAESYYSILNACKKQNPKVLLIESLYLFRYSLGDDTQMLLSQPIYYRVPFLKYHNIWKSQEYPEHSDLS